MKNYWLERVLEKENTTLSWDLNRVQLLESLIRPTAEFGVELANHIGQPSIFDYESIIQDHTSGSCDPNNVRAWVYVSLLRKAVQDANAVALLRSESLWSQAINLWRSLFQTDVVCQYVGDRSSNDHLPCRYVIHSIIRPTVRHLEEFNATCRALGKPERTPTKRLNAGRGCTKENLEKGGETTPGLPNLNTILSKVLLKLPSLTCFSTVSRTMRFTLLLEKLQW